MRTFSIAQEHDTARIAAVLVPALRGGMVIGLSGDLGAGKTTFVRYLIAAAGGDTRAVSSPTYTLQHEYPLPRGITVEHWDLYRLSTLPLELEERTPSTVVRIIEWPERCPEILPSLSCYLRFERVDAEGGEERRSLEVSGVCAGEIVTLIEGEEGRS